jgi:hypothetical protein
MGNQRRKSFFLLLLLLVNKCFLPYESKAITDDSLYVSYKIADKPFYHITGTKIEKNAKIKPIPVAIFAATYTGIFIIQHIEQNRTIWKNKGSFHFAEDGKYAMYVDKAGHFYGTFLPSYVLSQSLLECGMNYNWSVVVGTLLGVGYTTYVEILDGFAKDWGFSPSDFYADIAGGLFFLGYSYIPFMQNFTPKFMYFPPRWFNSYSRKPSSMFIDDYSAQTFWLSINLQNILPEKIGKYIPKWLDISVGYAVRNLCNPLDTSLRCNPELSEPVYPYVWGNRKLIIALDYDLVKLLPDGGHFWNWLKQSLNYFKLPSPAIEIGKPIRFYLLYPFPIQIGSMKF